MTGAFEIVPAIDLSRGRCVRLRRGEPGTETLFSDDPVEIARRFAASGATRLHVVDLDGAFAGAPRNGAAIRAILEAVAVPVQVGGGLRDLATVERVLALGARWAILGTAALRDPALVRDACARFPGRIAAAVDAKGGRVAVSGWTEVSTVDADELGARLGTAGVAFLLHTDIDLDGMLAGPNLAATARFARAAKVPVLASGGVSSLDDLARLRSLAPDGVAGAVVGRALYTGALDLGQALALCRGERPC